VGLLNDDCPMAVKNNEHRLAISEVSENGVLIKSEIDIRCSIFVIEIIVLNTCLFASRKGSK